MKSFGCFCAGLALSVLAGASSAVAQAPFYEGKRITILNNFGPGGPNDVEIRLVARHLRKHIGGQPNIIFQDKEGAGGLVGTKYLGEVAPKDGSIIGYLSAASSLYANSPELFTVDFRTYEFIAYVASNAVYYM